MRFLPFMGTEASFFNCSDPFEQRVNTLLTVGLVGSLVKIAQVVSENTAFKNYIILYIFI